MSPLLETFATLAVRGWRTLNGLVDKYVAIGHSLTPFVTTYAWSNGFGAKFANPTTLPVQSVQSVKFNKLGSTIFVGDNNINAYAWSSAGFGTKFAGPSVNVGSSPTGLFSHPLNTAIAVAHFDTFSVYGWSNGFGTKYAAALGGGITTSDIAFNSTGNTIVGTSQTTPFIYAYPWTGSSIGTKYANPASLPNGQGYSIRFSNNGLYVAVGVQGPNFSVYPWSAGWGTRYAAPATYPGIVVGVSFNNDDTVLGYSNQSAGYAVMGAYAWSSGGFGTKFADPAGIQSGNGKKGADFGSASKALVVGSSSSPYIQAYAFSGGFGAKYADPTTISTGTTIYDTHFI